MSPPIHVACNISEVLDTKAVSHDSIVHVRVSSVHSIPGTTTSKDSKGEQISLYDVSKLEYLHVMIKLEAEFD